MAAPPLEQLQSEWEGLLVMLRVLGPALGPIRTMAAVGEMAFGLAKGEPFAAVLGPETDDQDRDSRRQIAPVVLLYRALKNHLGEEKAMPLVQDVVVQASVAHLKVSVPRLNRQEFLGMPPARRRAFCADLATRFPNADVDITEDGQKAVDFTVRRCRFVEMFAAVGEPQLAPLFCLGDAIFFERHQPQVVMSRTQEISRGADHCDFRFEWKDV